MINTLENSPVQALGSVHNNNIYIKREDKLSLSYGGNKVRFAQRFLSDMRQKGCDCMLVYGSRSSNLCRVCAQLCHDSGVRCAVIYSGNDGDSPTNNSRIVARLADAEYICPKGCVKQTVELAMSQQKALGFTPYYIYGDSSGKGNECVPVSAYCDMYGEIARFEQESSVSFDMIFIAVGTAASYSGLYCGLQKAGKNTALIGISISRDADKCKEIIAENAEQLLGYRPAVTPVVTDDYLLGGYGQTACDELLEIDQIYDSFGIPLDPTYSGKAWYGMKEYLKKHKLTNKNVLFIHTGGYPIFCDYKGISL